MSTDEPDRSGSTATGAAKRPADADRDADRDPESWAGRPWDLRLAWAEHRPYVLAATALFAVGLLAGLAMAAAGIDLLALLGLENLEDLLPEDAALTVEFIFLNNSQVYFLLIVGALSLGLLTALLLGFNGLVVGWVVGLVAGQIGVGPVLALLLPHGVFELPAFWIAGGIGLRLVHLAVQRIRGTRERLLTRPELSRIALLVLAGWVLVGIAAVVEVYVTPAVAEAIYGAPNPAVG